MYPPTPPSEAPSPPARTFPNALETLLWIGAAGLAAYAFYEVFLADPEPRRIRQLARAFEDEGANVYADLKGWPQPPLLEGRRPDVFADFGDEQIAVEVENDVSVDRHHARQQDHAFRRWESRSPRRRAYTQEIVDGGRGARS